MRRDHAHSVHQDADATPLPVVTLRAIRSSEPLPDLMLPSGILTPRADADRPPATPIDQSFEEHEDTMPSARPPAMGSVEVITAGTRRETPSVSPVVQIPARPVYVLLGTIVFLLALIALTLLVKR